MIRDRILSVCGALLLGLGLIATPGPEARAQDQMVMVTGEHWQQMDDGDRVAFISGVMHVVEFERQLDEGQYPEGDDSFIPYLVEAMQGRTLSDVVIKVNEYYRQNPNEAKRPVIDAIFQAIVIPTL